MDALTAICVIVGVILFFKWVSGGGRTTSSQRHSEPPSRAKDLRNCPDCHGEGTIWDPVCKGEGVIYDVGPEKKPRQCPTCGGTRKVTCNHPRL